MFVAYRRGVLTSRASLARNSLNGFFEETAAGYLKASPLPPAPSFLFALWLAGCCLAAGLAAGWLAGCWLAGWLAAWLLAGWLYICVYVYMYICIFGMIFSVKLHCFLDVVDAFW